jgi:hypothetical protein
MQKARCLTFLIGLMCSLRRRDPNGGAESSRAPLEVSCDKPCDENVRTGPERSLGPEVTRACAECEGTSESRFGQLGLQGHLEFLYVGGGRAVARLLGEQPQPSGLI